MGATPDASELDAWLDGDMDWISPGDLAPDLSIGTAARRLDRRAVASGPCPSFPADSTLIVGIGATAGRVAHLTSEATGNQQMTCVVVGPMLLPRFLSWQLWARQEEIRATAPYTTLPIISNDFLKGLLIDLPTLEVQAAAVRTLDQTTLAMFHVRSSIDRQTRLLTERRQALITAAVTGELEIPGTAA